MKLFSANIDDLQSLYVNNLKKALDMEQKITRALPDLIEMQSSFTSMYTLFTRTPFDESISMPSELGILCSAVI